MTLPDQRRKGVDWAKTDPVPSSRTVQGAFGGLDGCLERHHLLVAVRFFAASVARCSGSQPSGQLASATAMVLLERSRTVMLDRSGISGPPRSPQEGSIMEYRRKRGSDTWHWCRNCSNWPTSDYESRYTKPTTGELDNECRSKEAAGACSSS